VRTYKDSEATRKKKSESAKRFWRERRKKRPRPEVKVSILFSVAGGDVKKYLKAMRTLKKRGPLSAEANESLHIIEKLEPELFKKYFIR